MRAHRSSRRDMVELLERARRRGVPALPELEVPPLEMPVAAGEITAATSATGGGPPSRRELRVLLELAGSRPTPAPSPVFVATTDAVLRGEPSDAVPLVERPRRSRRARTPAVLTGAAAAAVALVLVGALTGVMGGPGEGDADALSLGASVDTTVVLPDGTTVEGARGLALPEGSTVRTGPHGHAVIDGVELGPASVATVEGGRLRAVTGPETPTQSATPDAPAAGPSTTSPAAVAETEPPATPPAPSGPPASPRVTVPAAPILPTAPTPPTVPTVPVGPGSTPSTLLPQLTLPNLLGGR